MSYLLHAIRVTLPNVSMFLFETQSFAFIIGGI
jgi:hypothetical protein